MLSLVQEMLPEHVPCPARWSRPCSRHRSYKEEIRYRQEHETVSSPLCAVVGDSKCLEDDKLGMGGGTGVGGRVAGGIAEARALRTGVGSGPLDRAEFREVLGLR